jgi:hypothetical protein
MLTCVAKVMSAIGSISATTAFSKYFSLFQSYYYYYYVVVAVATGLFSLLNLLTPRCPPPPPTLQFHTAALSVLCVMSPVQLSAVVDLSNVFLV